MKTEEKKSSDRVIKREEDLGRSRKDLIVLEHKLSALKQKSATMQLLVKK